MILSSKFGKTRSQPKLSRQATRTPKMSQDNTFCGGKSKLASTYSSLQKIPKQKPIRRSMDEGIKFNPKYEQQNINWLSQFILEVQIGEGAFGKMWKVIEQHSHKIYALKILNKRKIIHKNSAHLVINQRNILAMVKPHAFLVNAIQASQDSNSLYLLLQYMPGGDLRYLMYQQRRRFTEEQSKFLVCCILIAIQTLHQQGVIHRDLKPQNLVLDSKGYLRVTDMGISKIITKNLQPDNSGTPAYMAPEALEFNAQTLSVDYYALGVVAYELINGKRPFQSKTRQDLLNQMKSTTQLQFTSNVTHDGADLVRSLLQLNSGRRLGRSGVDQVMKHPWFNGIDWGQFRKKKYLSPFGKTDPKRRELTIQQYNRLIDSQQENQPEMSQVRIPKMLFKGYNFKYVKN